jgi:lysylphosphatidylglycerol synthetase-like protein (DUF2156 family)
MNQPARKLLYWTPRLLALAFAAFTAVFALDVFEGLGFWKTVLALLIHLLPTAILLIVAALAWRWEWIGAAAFAALGVAYLVLMAGRHLHWSVYAIMSGPMFLLAILFGVGWLLRDELRHRTT